MDANPILAEMTRGNWVENRHRGAFVVSDAKGNIIASAGDIDRPIFPRSAVKSMQALALVSSGALYKFDLTDEELALACASRRAATTSGRRPSRLIGSSAGTPWGAAASLAIWMLLPRSGPWPASAASW